MKINSTYSISLPKIVKNNTYCTKPYPCDSISFSGLTKKVMKKSSYQGFDYYYLDKVNNKLPQNRFSTEEELQKIAAEHLSKLYNSDKLLTPENEMSLQKDKTRIINNWKEAISKLPNTTACIIFTSICSDIKYNNKKLPPEFDIDIFNETLREIEAKLKKDRSSTFNFKNLYKKNLKIKYINEEKEKLGITDEKNNGFWMCIPSKYNDEKNFEENAKKLKALSSDFWCTTEGDKSREAIFENDFYLFIKSNEAKIGVRLAEGKIYDVQGKLNDYLIPYKHIDKVEQLITENNFQYHPQSKTPYVINRGKKALTLFKNIPDAIKNKDYFTIMETMGYKPKKLENGLFEIESYDGFPGELSYFKKYGITEKDFFQNIERIRGDANFSKCQLSNLMNLKYIGGNANFSTDLPEDKYILRNLAKLEFIGGNANFYDSYIEDLGNLTYIGGNLNCLGRCLLNDLGNLKHIVGNASLNSNLGKYYTQLETLGNKDLLASLYKE